MKLGFDPLYNSQGVIWHFRLGKGMRWRNSSIFWRSEDNEPGKSKPSIRERRKKDQVKSRKWVPIAPRQGLTMPLGRSKPLPRAYTFLIIASSLVSVPGELCSKQLPSLRAIGSPLCLRASFSCSLSYRLIRRGLTRRLPSRVCFLVTWYRYFFFLRANANTLIGIIDGFREGGHAFYSREWVAWIAGSNSKENGF